MKLTGADFGARINGIVERAFGRLKDNGAILALLTDNMKEAVESK